MSFKAHSTAYSISDSLKAIAPRGLYSLNEEGARMALKARVDAEIFEAKWKIADDELTVKTGKLMAVMAQNQEQKAQITRDEKTISTLKKRLFWTNVWKYTAMAGAALLGTKLILNQ